MPFRILLASALAASVISASANAALLSRLGGQAVYDTDLNITWLTNANLAATNNFGVNSSYSGGFMNWYDAQAWIGAMNTANYLGYHDWRLPTVTDSGAPGCNYGYSGTDCGFNVNTATGEMAHLFYDSLGNKSYYDTTGAGSQPGWGPVNVGLFTNLQTDYGFMSGTEYAPAPSQEWGFGFWYGYQGPFSKNGGLRALVVRPGDVATVPLPAATYLLGSGLLALLGAARRYR